jgi:uncharacterized protein (TIGR02217 family)
MSFHEVQFPTTISRGSSGGPRRLTDIVTLRSGYEKRNIVWEDSLREYNAGLGIQQLEQLYDVLAFFEARRGRLYGFRWKDWADYKSSDPVGSVSSIDQNIGTGDGTTTAFQLRKTYSDSAGSYTRIIKKPVSGTVVAAIGGTPTTSFTVNTVTGIITFSSPPTSGASVTAGFEFDVPVRFDNDTIITNVELFNVGSIPTVNIVEIKI